MDSGILNRRVTIQKQSSAQDSAGQPIGWIDVATVWANIAGKRGLQYVRGDVMVGEANFSIRIRYRTDVDSTMRVVYQNQLFEIMATLPDLASQEYMDLVCRTYATNG